MADNARRLAVNLYTELLSRLVKLINRSIRPPVKQPCNMFMFDSPGFQNPSTIGKNINIYFDLITLGLFFIQYDSCYYNSKNLNFLNFC